MKLVRWELGVGLVKGLVFGMRPYEFFDLHTDNDKEIRLYEVDHVIYLGFVQVILTMIYTNDSATEK